MATRLPELAQIDYTSLDFQSIINLTTKLIQDHPDYFVGIDDFQASNAGRMTVELVSYVVDLLADRIDWVANELTLPTTTQKENAANLLKLINYRLELPKTAAVTVTATITQYISPFAIPARYRVPATGVNGTSHTFELLNKDSEGRYIYEGVGSSYQFDTGVQVAPVLSHNDLVFYEGSSHRETFTMQGVNNEFVELSRQNIEEGSVRVWRVQRNIQGEITSRRELPIVESFLSPEAQDASSDGLQPLTLETTNNNSLILQFGESNVVETFNPNANEEIIVWYRVTSGQTGNITRNAINYTTTLLVSGQNIQVSFVNPTAASGGQQAETLENAKRYAPLRLTTAEKTVNPQDFVVLLQEFGSLINSITYGKSNEPNEIIDDFGYHIPPFEAWIYPIFDKPGWPSFPTYAYESSFEVGRPYVKYGPLDEEMVMFDASSQLGENQQLLHKLYRYALNNDYSNVIVYSADRRTTYIPGDDYVVDLESRTINRIIGGGISGGQTVAVRYFENDEVGDAIEINFATGDEQQIPESPVFPGKTTEAWSIRSDRVYHENTESFNSFNYPTNDYYIDYTTSTIVRKSPQPFLDSQLTFGASATMQDGVNNEMILAFDGLNRTSYNTSHDFRFYAFGGWATAGDGQNVGHSTGSSYYFKVALDGGEFVEYVFQSSPTTIGGQWSMRELVEQIYQDAVAVDVGGTPDPSRPFSDSGVILYSDTFDDPPTRILTFASPSRGVTSSVELASGTTGTDLFGQTNLTNLQTGSGSEIDILELALRARGTLNSLGLCSGFQGQLLALSNEEKPEIYSKANLISPASFELPVGNNQVIFTLNGTGGTTYDGQQQVTFSTVTSNGPYDLTRLQEQLDLITDMQTDMDSIGTGFGSTDVVEVFMLPTPPGNYRIGFRLVDTASTTEEAWIMISDATDSARLRLQFSNDQTSQNIDTRNLVDGRVSPDSNFDTTHLLRIQMLGASGEPAFIQVQSDNALHNNTLSLLGMVDNQYKRGTSILSRVLPAIYEVVSDLTGLEYTITNGVDDQFNLNITSAPSGFSDGDYEITIVAGTYNLTQLIAAINTAFANADYQGTPTDISGFLKCEKQYGSNSIRLIMTDFDGTALDPPEIIINDDNDETIGQAAIDKLGFTLNESMSEFSTIQLQYAGNWISDETADTSEEASINVFLENKQLICQDYIVKDPRLLSFDIKGTVYVSRGFDIAVVKNQVVSDIREQYIVNEREFAESVAISQILRIVDDTEGVQYTVIDYFGKDYQAYEQYVNRDKTARIVGLDIADFAVIRWNEKSAFKITVDGTATPGGLNYDGEYLVVIGNSWTNRDYDSLLDALINGDGVTDGLAHAIPLAMGGVETNLALALDVKQSSGIFTISSKNEGPSVSIKIEPPENVNTYGYQVLSREDEILESEYLANNIYSITVEINGDGGANYEITSPASGDWPLYILADQLDDALPAGTTVGMDEEDKIRITSTLSGNQSTIDITDGTTGINLLTLIGPAESPIDGTSGYVDAISSNKVEGGSLSLLPEGDNSLIAYGLPDEPPQSIDESAYNYRTEIPANYDEILFISDDYYLNDVQTIEAQTHGIILNFVELGR